MGKFSQVPSEIRLLISEYIDEWPDHKAFRQTDRWNYSLLTDTQEVRKKFGKVDDWLIGKFLNGIFTSPPTASGIQPEIDISAILREKICWLEGDHPKGRHMTLPSHKDHPAAVHCAKFTALINNTPLHTPKPPKDWLTFVYHNDYLASLRKLQTAVHLTYQHIPEGGHTNMKKDWDQLGRNIYDKSNISICADFFGSVNTLNCIIHIAGLCHCFPPGLSLRVRYTIDDRTRDVLEQVEYYMKTALMAKLSILLELRYYNPKRHAAAFRELRRPWTGLVPEKERQREVEIENECLQYVNEWARKQDEFMWVWARLAGKDPGLQAPKLRL